MSNWNFYMLLVEEQNCTAPLQKRLMINGNPLQYSCLENPMDGGAW